jgi:hypothetical protein
MDFSKPPEGCDHEKVKQAEAFFNRRRIVISAIKQPNGRIYIGLRHHNCIAAAADAGEEIPIIGEQGFLDNNGNFLGREEALPIAEAAGQIKEKTNPLYMLFSDVW